MYTAEVLSQDINWGTDRSPFQPGPGPLVGYRHAVALVCPVASGTCVNLASASVFLFLRLASLQPAWSPTLSLCHPYEAILIIRGPPTPSNLAESVT